MLALGALQAAAVLIIGWVAGHVIVGRLKSVRDDLGLPERALLGIVGFVLFSVALMVGNLISGGAVFGTSFIVPIVVIGLVGLRGLKTPLPRGVPWLKVGVLALALALIYVRPLVVGGSGVRTGDPPWHMGWSNQLLAGEPVPTGPAPEEVSRNAYPWGYHAVIATVVRLVPGTDPLDAHEGLHLLFLMAIPVAAACLARRLDPRAGWLAAAAVALVGGFGWIEADGPVFIPSPSDARFGADLVVASPNALYELFPSALPRELGLALLGAFGSLLVIGARRADDGALRWAGVVGGVTGLVSVPMLVNALVWLPAVALAPSGRRLRSLGMVAAPLVAVFGLWFGPVLASYVSLGGFVQITPRLGVEWPVVTAIGSWGVLGLGAVAGIVLARRRGPELVAFAGGTVALLALALARREFGWELGGVPTLLHQGRVWPVAHLLGAAFAGLAATVFLRSLAGRSRAAAAASALLLVAAAVPSPVLASQGLDEILRSDDAGFVYDSDDLGGDGFVRRAAARLGPDDVVVVEGPDVLGFLLFQFSGCRLGAYDDPSLVGNDLRIRYAELAERWDRRTAGEGFEADYAVVEGPAPGALVEGAYGGRTWALVPR